MLMVWYALRTNDALDTRRRQVQCGLLKVSLSRRLAHLQRLLPWEQVLGATLRVELAISEAAAAIFRLPAMPAVGPAPAGDGVLTYVS